MSTAVPKLELILCKSDNVAWATSSAQLGVALAPARIGSMHGLSVTT